MYHWNSITLNIQLQLYIQVVQIKVQALSNDDTKKVYQSNYIMVAPGYWGLYMITSGYTWLQLATYI